MWVLVCQKNPECYALCPGESYKVGRVGVDIFARDDQSVSRIHGVFRVENRAEISQFKSQVIYEDFGSTYGSYVGDAAIASSQVQDTETGEPSQKDRLRKGEKATLVVNTKIRIGLFSTIFKLEWRPMVVSCSTLKMSEKATLRDTLSKVGGNLLTKENKLVDDWTDEVSHLVMNQVTLTLKVANALAKGIPIVTPAFLSDFLVCQNTKQILPDPKQYIPPLSESTINANDVSLAVRKERQQLFKGRFFAFATQTQMAKFEQCISYAGGQAGVFAHPNSKYRDPSIFEIPNNLLIQPEQPIKTLFASPSHRDQLRLWQEAESVLASKNFKMIAVSSIGLALLNCSTRVHCNPDRACLLNRSTSSQRISESQTPIQRKSEQDLEILAPETQFITQVKPKNTESGQSKASPSSSYSSYIPESELPKTNDVFVKPQSKEIRTDFGNTSTIPTASGTSVKPPSIKSLLTSTPATSSFWNDDNNDDDDEDDGDDFFAFCDDKKRKRQTNDSEAVATPSKRSRSDAAKSDTIASASSKNDVTLKHLQVSVLSTKKRFRPDDEAEALPKTKKVTVKEEEEDLFEEEAVEPEVNTKVSNKPVNKTVKTTPANKEPASSNPRPFENEVTIVDEFGFIGKSFAVKKETSKSGAVDAELSKDYSNVQIVPLVLEKSLRELKIRSNGNYSNSSNGSSNHINNVKKFRKQSIPPLRRRPVICRIIEDEEGGPDASNMSVAEPVGQENNLDNWVTREKQIVAEEKESDDFWAFSETQSQRKSALSSSRGRGSRK